VPEGDVVWRTARQLHDALAGRVLVRTDFRVPRYATASLTGQTVTEVVSRGKHLLARTDAGWTLHSHLKMEGSWRVYPSGQPWRGGPGWQIRAVLETDEASAVGYRLGVVELVRTSEEGTVVGQLGPDLLGPDWDEAEAVRRLLGAPGVAVGEALLDQRNLAGIGNLYKAEALFLCGVHPNAPVGSVPDLSALVRCARELMTANLAGWEQVTTGDRRRRHWVYERAGLPCRRCGTVVRSQRQGAAGQQRVSYWCPRCQPALAGAAATS
jgi:endonuclease-8